MTEIIDRVVIWPIGNRDRIDFLVCGQPLALRNDVMFSDQ
jgi:hypothetical protein